MKVELVVTVDFLYIVKPREFINTNVFKIGRTGDIVERLRAYGKGSYYVLVFQMMNATSNTVETMLKHSLIAMNGFKHRTDIGAEYFEAVDHQLFRRTVFDFLQENDVDANMSSSVPAHLLPSTSRSPPVVKESVVVHNTEDVPSMRVVQMFCSWIASHFPTFVVHHTDFLEAINNIYSKLLQSLSGSHHDIAATIKALYANSFRCTSIKDRLWVCVDDDSVNALILLRKKIYTDVVLLYDAFATVCLDTCASTQGADAKMWQQRCKDARNISNKLKSSCFQGNVLRECAEVMFQES
jgi:hypothetical protein